MKIKRTFNLTDAKFIEHSEVVSAKLPGDLPDFTAFDTTIDSDYATQLQQAIDAAKAIPPDDIVMNELMEETQKVAKAMEDCRSDYQSLMFFVRKAFKGNAAIQEKFGRKEIHKAGKSQPLMVAFMENLAKTAADYTADLTQAGCPATLITGLTDKAEALRAANVAQEQSKSERTLNTQSRIELLNKVNTFLQILHDAATIIYRDNPPKLGIYTLPKRQKKSSSGSETPEDTTQ